MHIFVNMVVFSVVKIKKFLGEESGEAMRKTKVAKKLNWFERPNSI